MQDENNHRQDKLTLRMTTLIFILCFLVPVIYSLVTGKCLFNTCSLKLECLKGFIAEKNKDSFCCSISPKQSEEKPPAVLSSAESDKGGLKPGDSQQKNFNVSG